MGRGSSKASGSNSVPRNVISLNSENTLKGLQKKAEGTEAEDWYKDSGQSYEQLKAMENIYDIVGKTSNVRSYSDVEKDASLSQAMKVIDDAPNGTIVSYQVNNNTAMVMKKGNGGQWTSYELFSPTPSMAVVIGGSYTKYNKLKALNTFTTLQAGALRKTLNKTQMKGFRGFL